MACLVASSCITRLYEEIDCRDDLGHLLGIHAWYFTVAAVPQLLWYASEDASAEENLCAEDLDILSAALQQYQTKRPGATPVLNAINRLRASQSQFRVQSYSKMWDMQGGSGITDAHNMSVLRELFPFPETLSPRLVMLDISAHDMVTEAAVGTGFTEDMSCMFGNLADLSNGLAFDDWYSFSQVY